MDTMKQIWFIVAIVLLMTLLQVNVACMIGILVVDTQAYVKRLDKVWRRKRRPMASLIVKTSRTAVTACVGLMLRQCSSFTLRSKMLSSSVRLLRLSFLLFSFLILFFLCSMIKTDMVVVKKPDLISSYADILTPGTKPRCHGLVVSV